MGKLSGERSPMTPNGRGNSSTKAMPIIRRKWHFSFAWYDAWMGVFWDRRKRILYVCPLPCLLIETWKQDDALSQLRPSAKCELTEGCIGGRDHLTEECVIPQQCSEDEL